MGKYDPVKAAEYRRRYREKDRAYREANKERIRTRTQQWYAANRDAVQARNREWLAKQDPEAIKAYRRAYYEAHREEIKARVRAYKRERPEIDRQRSRQRCEERQAARAAIVRACVDCGAEVRVRGRKGMVPELCEECCAKRRSRREKAYAKAHPEKKRAQKRSMYARSERVREQAKALAAARRARLRLVAVERVSHIAVFERDGWRCQICGKRTPKERRGTRHANAPELDHRVPLSRGGAHSYDNLQCACHACNASKSNKSEIGQMPLWSRPITEQPPPGGEVD